MSKLISYIAISLDGKIAAKNGDFSWLDEVPNPEQTDYGYSDFIRNIGTTIMGNETYKVVLNIDMPFPYTEQTNYVVTRDKSLTTDENVTFMSGDIPAQIADLKAQSSKDIWLIGGGQVNAICLKAGLLDEIIVHIMPYVLGEGIPIFADEELRNFLTLKSTKTYSSGVVELRYTVNKT
ncbi:dihydrofolate reductase [Roseivirga pacifica]|uniref:Dihydrofolate reductase n=1 Tax=Roseivirga pacifica TaxID=1267423 RepID=A0A1I0NH16_9BACT|nr:dihydrofolate reductase family protein [Roseivirga pacifica]RKQ51195.1 dihydrofolate reductase [Roseivirga pacifica]SEW00761.1 Dihydrofolate reductase [Roseivirga pacifica]